MELLKIQMAAGEWRQLASEGQYFEIVKAAGELDLVLTTSTGGTVARAKGAKQGYYIKTAGYHFVDIRSDVEQVVEMWVGAGEAGTRTLSGAVTLDGAVELKAGTTVKIDSISAPLKIDSISEPIKIDSISAPIKIDSISAPLKLDTANSIRVKNEKVSPLFFVKNSSFLNTGSICLRANLSQHTGFTIGRSAGFGINPVVMSGETVTKSMVAITSIHLRVTTANPPTSGLIYLKRGDIGSPTGANINAIVSGGDWFKSYANFANGFNVASKYAYSLDVGQAEYFLPHGQNQFNEDNYIFFPQNERITIWTDITSGIYQLEIKMKTLSEQYIQP